MPKKTATARSGAQRNRPKVQKVQKSVELVRKASDEQEIELKEIELSEVDVEETASSGVSVAVDEAPPITRKRERASNGSSRKSAESVSNSESVASEESSSPGSSGVTPSTPTTPLKGSAAARLVARRQAAHKGQQRAAANMITAEHYSYVVKDLRIIAILATIMLVGIIILYFVPGIGS